MKLNKKVKAQENHAIQRARERVGKDFTKSDLWKMVALILDGKSVLLGSCKVRKTQTHLIKYDDKVMRVLFDPGNEEIISFLGDDFKLGRSSKKIKKYGGKKPRRSKYRGKFHGKFDKRGKD